MPPTDKTGSDSLPATWGGPGFRPRIADHRLELNEARLWSRCGSSSEFAPLRAVLMTWPGEELRYTEPPNDMLMLGRPDLDRIRAQAGALAAFYESQRVAVHWIRPRRLPPPNLLFARDLFFMTPEGAILARPASQQRAGEERFAAEALAQLGIPILAMMRDTALLEGADLLWLSPTEVLFGVGQRSNQTALQAVRGRLQEMDVTVHAMLLPHGIQHLLGIMNFVDERRVVIDRTRIPETMMAQLHEADCECIELDDTDELRERRSMNFVCLRPNEVAMPAHCPRTRSRLESAGIATYEVAVEEYVRAGGGPACLTGILERG